MAIESETELRELASARVAAWNDRRLDDYYAGFAHFDRDGLIVEMFEYFDRLIMTEQLLGPG